MLVMIVLLLVMTSLAVMAQNVSLPTWPQPFSLKAGESATFAFPVTQPGQITVNVTWQGMPLTVKLAPLVGDAVAGVKDKPSPVTLTYAVTSTAIQKGIIWTVKVTAPGAVGASTQLVATGQVSVQAPDANPQAIQALASALRQGLRSRIVFPSHSLTHTFGQDHPATDGMDHAVLDIKAYDPSAVAFTKVEPTKNDDYWQVSQTVPGEIDAVHVGKMFVVFLGCDTYFSGVTLKNGWTVDEVIIVPSSTMSTTKAEIRPGDSHPGTSNASVRVSWSVDPGMSVLTYTLVVKIKGPKGTSWK
jgi:hypothetical protein